MRIAIIDSCQLSLELYSKILSSEAGAIVDHYCNPLHYLATRARKYDLLIADFYFETVNIDFYWNYLDPDRLIVLSGDRLDVDLECLGVFKKNSIHTRRNIVNLVRMIKPSLHLVPPDST